MKEIEAQETQELYGYNLRKLKSKLKSYKKPVMFTPHHLYNYLNLTWEEAMFIESMDEDMGRLLRMAKMDAVISIIDNGFLDDKSFSKWYLDKYIPAPAEVTEQITDNRIEIIFDRGPQE